MDKSVNIDCTFILRIVTNSQKQSRAIDINVCLSGHTNDHSRARVSCVRKCIDDPTRNRIMYFVLSTGLSYDQGKNRHQNSQVEYYNIYFVIFLNCLSFLLEKLRIRVLNFKWTKWISVDHLKSIIFL